MDRYSDVAPVPLRWVGPLAISGNAATGEIEVPLATFESPLWPSVSRGARVSRRCERGIVTTVVDERMTRSVLLTTPGADAALAAVGRLTEARADLEAVVATESRFARLLDVRHQIVGDLLFLRFEFATGDASGHNMATLASDALLDHILTKEPALRYGSVSGNFCTDKKPSAVNGILGRGKNVVAELLIPSDVVEGALRTTAAKVAELNVRKNFVGTTLAGGIRTANAHYANMVLAVYLATGQDGANVVEGSQGITHAEDRAGALYFSCSLPNIVVGTVGNGKNTSFAETNLARMGCRAEAEPGANARRLAAIVAATVLCGELSLMAAQTNPGELMRSHIRFERSQETVGKP